MRSLSRVIGLMLIVGLAFMTLVVPASAQNYPARPITGVIPWAPGGSTDIVSRAFQPLFEKYLGGPIVLVNQSGASGSIGTDFVKGKPADGYHILFSAETPGIMQVMDLSQASFEDFELIILMTRLVPTVTVNAKSPWNTLEELLADAKKNPGKITAGYAGVATTGHVASLMLGTYGGAKFTGIPMGGGGPVVTAVLGGHVDVIFASVAEVIDHARSGNLRILATFTNEPLDILPNVRGLGQIVPSLKPHLPWGTMSGVFVKKGTPPDIVEKLRAAARQVVRDPKWIEFCNSQLAISLGLQGEEGWKYIRNWTSVTTWLLYDAGAAKYSPEKFGIPRP